MTKTANDVATRALQIIRVVAAGETPSADDMQDALSEYEGVHENLMAEFRDRFRLSGANWQKDRVPVRMFPFVARVLAAELTSVFPVPDTVYPNADKAKQSMVKILAKRKTSHRRFPNMPTTQPWIRDPWVDT